MHNDLPELLLKYDLTYDQLKARGRPSREIAGKKRSLVTDLHLQGKTWKEMMEITGLSNGAIARLSNAKWGEVGKTNRGQNLPEMNRAKKGIAKPEMSDWLRKKWADGFFDFHRGSHPERHGIRRTEDVCKRLSEIRKALWKEESYRTRLMSFHQSVEERRRRSKQQTLLMRTSSCLFIRGQRSRESSCKHISGSISILVRSSYEARAIRVLDTDSKVKSYVYEMLLSDEKGYFYPDFIVFKTDGSCVLVEVKASWVLHLPEDSKVMLRLERASSYAKKMGWGFEVWTEKDRLKGASHVG